MTPAQAKIRSWRENPCQFVFDTFGVTPDPWQEDALRACGGPVTARRRLAMKACTGPGKSAALAWIGWHRLLCFGEKGEHPKGAALSGEGRDNLRDNLWAELSKWQQRSPLLLEAFTHNQAQIYAKDHPETWFLSARSYPKSANAEQIGSAMAGLHSRYPFILLDEIGNMPPTVGQKASQIFTGGCVDGLLAAAGNPTSNDGLLFVIFTQERDRWVCITITADPDDPKRTPRVDIEHAREEIKRWGRDNPWVMSTILGLFPPSSINALLGPDEVAAAMERHYKPEDYEHVQKRLGVDVARFGDDRTIIFPRQGLASFRPVEMRNARGPEIAARIVLAKAKWKGDIAEFIDDTGGWGATVIDSLLLGGHAPFAINASGKATDPRYFNKRAECWFELSKWVKRGGALPNMPGLAKELTTPTYTYQDGKFRVEEKDQIKKRLKYSPDLADALSLTFSFADTPSKDSLESQILGDRSKMKSDYDPMEESGSAPERHGKVKVEYDPFASF